MDAFISTEALALTLWNTHIKPVDASWFMPDSGRNAKAEYSKCHLPRAVYFNIDDICDTGSPFPHMLPNEEEFEQKVGAIGISNHDRVVIYDSAGLFSAARVWWMLRVFGFDKVQILEGGLPKWIAEGRQIESGYVEIVPARFAARFNPILYRSYHDIMHNIGTRQEQLLDARSPGRYLGTEPEPRPGLRSGHIPGAVNLHYRDCLDANGMMKPKEHLQQLFLQAGVDIAKPVVSSCGSGVTACILALAMHRMGKHNVPVYDGSWAEWGAIPESPVESKSAA